MKIKNTYVFLIPTLFSLFSFSAHAQDAGATAGIDSSSILIGNQTHFHLKISYNTRHGVPKIQWPAITDSLVSKVHVVSKSRIDTIIPDHDNPTQESQTQDLVITSFDSGYYAIPPFQFVVNGDTIHPILTDALMMQVRTVPVDTTKGFRDIKGPIQVKFPFIIILMYIGIAVVILAIIAFLIYYFVKKNKNKIIEPIVVKAPPVDPHIKALKALEELALKKLWQEGKTKEYYSGVSDILRIYLDDRFTLGALEMTTDEIMFTLRRKGELNDDLKNKLRQILVLSDLVKFAKEQPLPAENEAILSSAIDFINDSLRAQEPITKVASESITPSQSNNQTV